MSHGRTDLGAHMSTLMILSVMYTVAASLETSYKGQHKPVVQQAIAGSFTSCITGSSLVVILYLILSRGCSDRSSLVVIRS